MGFPFIGDIIGGVGKIIDDVTTSDEERLKAKQGLMELQIAANAKVLEYEATIIKERAAVIKAEAAGTNFWAANWRPFVMLFLTGLVGAHWLGFTPENITEDEALAMFELIKLGLGGYIIGRSAEKIVPATISAMKNKDKV